MPPSGEEWRSNPFIALTEQWLESWQRANELWQKQLEGMAPFWDPKILRSLWFAHLTRTLDDYMRSPEFLVLMQQSLRTMTRPTPPSSPQPDRSVSDGDHTTDHSTNVP